MKGNQKMNNIWILAQAEGQEAPSSISSEPVSDQGQTTTLVPDSNDHSAGNEGQKSARGYTSLIFIGLMFVMLYFIIFRGPQKQKQQHRKMMESLQKNDRVRTIGGIIGTIVDIKGDEITLKIDESNNTKIKIIASAIGKNLAKDKS
jgi:preprotein translocase subunit YajC